MTNATLSNTADGRIVVGAKEKKSDAVNIWEVVQMAISSTMVHAREESGKS